MAPGNPTKYELQLKLLEFGEQAPSSWTKIQLKARLAELVDEQKETAPMSERDAAKMVNKCKTKAALQNLMDSYQVDYTNHMNSDQLKSKMVQYLMENQVPASKADFMGFGKQSGARRQ